MLTMKFGGTSVGDVPRLQEVAAIVKQFLGKQPVVVASAMSGVTNLLLDTSRRALERKSADVSTAVAVLRDKHLSIANALIPDERRRAALIGEQQESIDELANLYRGVSLLRELTPRSLDAIASFGEILSCRQVAAILQANGIDAQFVDARTIIRTDDNFGEASIDFPYSNAAISQALAPLVR